MFTIRFRVNGDAAIIRSNVAKRKTKAQIPTLRLRRNDLSTGKRIDDIRYSIAKSIKYK